VEREVYPRHTINTQAGVIFGGMHFSSLSPLSRACGRTRKCNLLSFKIAERRFIPKVFRTSSRKETNRLLWRSAYFTAAIPARSRNNKLIWWWFVTGKLDVPIARDASSSSPISRLVSLASKLSKHLDCASRNRDFKGTVSPDRERKRLPSSPWKPLLNAFTFQTSTS